MKPATQKDIARRLNVSVMTVSKALKSHPDISEKTRTLVQRTAREMRYTVNVIARSLVRRHTQTIGVVVPDISEPFYAEMIRAIERRLRRHGYNLLLADSDNDPDAEADAVRTLLEKRVDGCIVGPTEGSRGAGALLHGGNVPFVLVNAGRSFSDCDVISIDRADGARQSIRHLLAAGYQDIYFLYTFGRLEQSHETRRGCREAFDAFGRPGARLHLVHCQRHELRVFYEAARDHVHDRGRRIGLFVWDDEMAVGVYRAVVEKGWEIPGRVGIVGFDDVKASRFLPKALTTIAYPKTEMGELAADRLVELLRAKLRRRGGRTLLPVKLVERETTTYGALTARDVGAARAKP